MRNQVIALLLLLVFGGGLFTGAHACQLAGTVPESDQSKPGCHGSGAATASTASTHHGHGTPAPSEHKGDGCTDETGGCKHACHMVALIRVQVAVFAVQPQARMVTSTFDRSLPLFAPPIDHIPLA